MVRGSVVSAEFAAPSGGDRRTTMFVHRSVGDAADQTPVTHRAKMPGRSNRVAAPVHRPDTYAAINAR